MKLQRKTAANFWQDVFDKDIGKVVFTSQLFNVIISGVGTYRVQRPDISEYGVDIGVSSE